MAIWNILRPSGTFYGHFGNSVVIWYIFSPFWYIVSRKIWQPRKDGRSLKTAKIPLGGKVEASKSISRIYLHFDRKAFFQKRTLPKNYVRTNFHPKIMVENEMTAMERFHEFNDTSKTQESLLKSLGMTLTLCFNTYEA
jgi:hypothetical protein